MKKSTVLVTLVVFLITSTFVYCVGYGSESPHEILEEGLKKYNSTGYEVTIVDVMTKNGTKLQKSVRHGIYKGSRFRVSGEEVITVSNGSFLWIYWNNTKTLIMSDFSRAKRKPANEFSKIFQDLLDNYDLELDTTQDIYVIKATNKNKFVPTKTKTVWIDRELLYPVKVVSILDFENGENFTLQTEYKGLKFGDFNDEVFNVPPPKAEIVFSHIHLQRVEEAQRMVNFTISVPDTAVSETSLSLKEVMVFKISDRKVKELREGVILTYKEKCFLRVI